MIPKTIWQTHSYLLEELPLFLRGPMLSWMEKNSTFKHNYVDHFSRRSFIDDTFGNEWLSFYDRCESQVFQADMWRVLCLYEHGGVYADMDTICLSPIDSFMDLDKDFICEAGFPKDHGWINTSIFASAPKGKFISKLKDVIYMRCASGNGESISIKDCGPLAFSEAMDSYIENNKDVSDIVFANFNYPSNNEESVLQIYGSTTWNDVKWGFDFSYLNEIYKPITGDSKLDIKFYTKKGHGGWNGL
jgi:mannosyltransferase OCH1-like enzyme